MPDGPSCDAPVVLLKTWSPSFTICTYCVAPTSPFVSGGAQLQPTPGKRMPSKFRVVPGILGAKTLVWSAPSGAFLCDRPVFGFGLASRSLEGLTGTAGIRLSGRETSFL